MAYPQGINFRATAAYVTDGANEDPEVEGSPGSLVTNITYPRTTAQGNTVGWETGNLGISVRDRSTSVDRRLAGCAFNGTQTLDFRFDLPAAGSYSIRVAAGEETGYNRDTSTELLDDTTSLAQLTSGTNAAGNSFKDATNTEYTAANWPGSNTAVTHTFASTIARFRMAGTFLFVNHYYMEAVSGPITGTVAATLGNVTLSSAGAGDIAGTYGGTLEPVTLSSVGSTTIVGTVGVTLENAILSSVGVVDIAGTYGGILEPLTLSSTGSTTIDGAAGITLGDVTLSSGGVVGIAGAYGGTLEPVTLSSTGVTTIDGSVGVTFGNVTLSSTGAADIAGTYGGVLEPVTMSSTGELPVGPISGSVDVTLGQVTLVSTGHSIGVTPIPPQPPSFPGSVFIDRSIDRRTGLLATADIQLDDVVLHATAVLADKKLPVGIIRAGIRLAPMTATISGTVSYKGVIADDDELMLMTAPVRAISRLHVFRV